MQGYCDVYEWTILKRTSPEVKCLHPTSSRREMCTLSVSNVIYHKFSHGAAFYTLNGKNVNVMLELRGQHRSMIIATMELQTGVLSTPWQNVMMVTSLRQQHDVIDVTVTYL